MKANLKILVVQMNILSNVFGTDVRKTNVEHACKLLEKHLASNKEVDIAVYQKNLCGCRIWTN